MNAPPRPDGPPVKRGLPYSAIAHLAEDVKPFVAIAAALRARGFSAPKIFAADYEAGFVVLEDLGSEPVVGGSPPPADGGVERYERASRCPGRAAPPEACPRPYAAGRPPGHLRDSFAL